MKSEEKEGAPGKHLVSIAYLTKWWKCKKKKAYI